MIIYVATNKLNGKQYVGKTTRTLEARRLSHEYEATSGSNNAIHRAIRKWGKDNFEWRVIEECSNEEHLSRAEIEHIKFLDTYSRGYNMTRGGEGQLGWNPQEETRKLWSKQRKGTNQYTRGYIHPDNPSSWTDERKEQEKLKSEDRKREANKKRSEKLKGRKAWNAGKKTGPWKREHIKKIQASRRSSGYVWTIKVIDAMNMNELGTYFSQAECCRALKLDPKKVRRVINTDQKYKGYYFRKSGDRKIQEEISI